jgi:hypothetical protein
MCLSILREKRVLPWKEPESRVIGSYFAYSLHVTARR